MRESINIFSFSYFFNNVKDRVFLYLLISLYFVYSLNIFPQDVLLIASLFIFVIAPINVSYIFFIFYLLWEYVTVFSFGITVVMVMQLIMLFKIILKHGLFIKPTNDLQKKLVSLQQILVVFLTIYAFFSLAFYQTFTAVSFVIKAFIAGYAISFFSNEDSVKNFWHVFFHIIMLSSIIATIYGFRYETDVQRWISELQDEVSQFSGTLGTTRMGMFYVLSIAYFLYYINNRFVKIAGILLFVFFVFMTISITASLLLVLLFSIYFLYKYKPIRAIVFAALTLSLVWLTSSFWMSLSFVKPLISRTNYSLENFKEGDVNSATSGRETTTSYFVNYFDNTSFLNKTLGTASTENMFITGAEMNTHNTYLDIIIFSGIVGLLLFLMYEIKKLYHFKDSASFYPYLTLKLVIGVGSLTVSVMSSSFYCLPMFL